ncbi:MAG: class I SAM-dependent methyltransferase [Burkholderiales bacterium]|nr:class I SAM-dependent methyltransferase [Burkholderiales bacterium]
MTTSLSRRHALSTIGASLAALAAASPTAEPPSDAALTEEVPYVQTPPHAVRRMLQLAEVGSGDTVWDLGSGDGRIVIAAARDFGARGAGYEIDPGLIAQSRRLARQAGVAARTQFLERDLFTLSFAAPTVLTMYLLPEFNLKLRPMLLAQMRPGARVVSHEWDMGDWQPDETLTLPAPDKPYGTARERKIFLWWIPAPVAGRWQVEVPGAPSHAVQQLGLDLTQQLQQVSARSTQGRVAWSLLRGTEMALAWVAADGRSRWLLSGPIRDGLWRGEAQPLGAWANTTNANAVRFVARRMS